MTLKQIAALVVVGLLTGCTTSHLPNGAQVVGGGLDIQWTAPRMGTAMLVEASSGKVVKTASVNEGDEFRFEPTDSDTAVLLNSMFASTNAVEDSRILAPLPKHSRFVLYFVPGQQHKE